MSLIYITGISGSGKSAVRAELLRRGYEAHGTDEDGIANFHNNETGEIVDNPIGAPPRTKEWREQHTWKISRQAVERLAEKAKNKDIFLCGVAGNDGEVWHLFSQIFALTLDEETFRQRITNRTNNNFGKAAHELESLLEWQRTAAEDYSKLGAVLIDATQPLEMVADEILDKVVDFMKVGQESLKAFVHTIQNLIRTGESFDIITAAGDSGQIAARITEEVYKALGNPVPPKLVAPIYRHSDEAETILFNNAVLVAQFETFKTKSLNNVLFVDDEIGSGNAARGTIDLLFELNPDMDNFTIVAENGGFECPSEIRGVKTRFIPTKTRIPNVYNAISYVVPWKLQEPLEKALADEPDLNNKQIMCTLLGLPTKEFNNGSPEFNDRLIERARHVVSNFSDLQKEYQEYLVTVVEASMR